MVLVADVAVVALTISLVFHSYTMSACFAVGKLTGVKALLDAVVLCFANIRFIGAITIQFTFIALLFVSTTVLQVVCIARIAGKAFTVSSMSTGFTASIRSTGNTVAHVQAV